MHAAFRLPLYLVQTRLDSLARPWSPALRPYLLKMCKHGTTGRIITRNSADPMRSRRQENKQDEVQSQGQSSEVSRNITKERRDLLRFITNQATARLVKWLTSINVPSSCFLIMEVIRSTVFDNCIAVSFCQFCQQTPLLR